MMTNCDAISWQNKNIKLKILNQQTVAAQKYQISCITILKVVPHNAIKIFVLFNQRLKQLHYETKNKNKQI